MKKKIGAKDRKPRPAEAIGWNDSTATGKYFDVNIDPREKRAAQAKQNEFKLSSRSAKIVKQSGNAIQVKTATEEPGKFNIEFQNRSGVTASAFQIYQNIDQLAADSQKPNYALPNYRVKNTPKVTMPERKLSTPKLSRRPKAG